MEGIHMHAPRPHPVLGETIWANMCRSWDVVEDSSTQAAFDRAAQWLSYCMKYDKSCKPPNQDFVPRRLLNVGHRNQTSVPFLFEPAEPLACACLSYCWGENVGDVLKTTTSNLTQHYKEIPLNSMPKSIQDAVRVCRGLDITYLWVDSLCIVQDDHDAWLQDASMMNLIYLNSHITIAALEPNSCKTGFLGKQRFGLPGWQRRVKLRGTSEEVIIRPEVDRTVECSLDKRGWCLQETLLPYRRLCFDGNEMTWECSCQKICECGHYVWPNDKMGLIINELSLAQLGSLLKEMASPSAPVPKPTVDGSESNGRYLEWLTGTINCSGRKRPERIYELWRRVVSSYSHRSLSQRSDKLIALAGLANIVRSHSRDENNVASEHLAGLWKIELPFELTWRVIAFKHKPELPADGESDPTTQEDHFPSWSWASCDEVINYDFAFPLSHWKYTPRAEDQCLVRGVEGISRNETSTAKSGRIRLEGKLAPVELAVFREHIPPSEWPRMRGSFITPTLTGTHEDRRSKMTAFVRSRNLRSVVVYLDALADPTMRKGDAQASCWIDGSCEDQCCSWDESQDNAKSRHYCFRLFSWETDSDENPHPRRKIGMGPETWFLLLKSSDRVEGAFERIGVGVWDDWRDFESCHLFETAETHVIDII